jgi:quinol monooxygenase YgiN
LKAQDHTQMVRIAKITVDSTQIASYQQALQKQMKAAINLEPGVLSYYAVADKLHPNQITILEIYADKDAYLKHIQTAHFKEYKETVKNMVLALELIDVSTFAASKKTEFLY